MNRNLNDITVRNDATGQVVIDVRRASRNRRFTRIQTRLDRLATEAS